MTATTDAALFAEFDKVSREQWIAAIEESLRGRSLDSLTKQTYEGIDFCPVATVDDLDGVSHSDSLPGQYPYLRGTRAAGYHGRSWLIAQELDFPDPRAFNHALRDALSHGQTAVVLGKYPTIENDADLKTALADIDLAGVPIFIADGARALNIYQLLRDAVGPETSEQLSGCIGCDPLGGLARTGALPGDAMERMAEHVKAVTERSPQLGCVAVRADVYHDAGANAVQELAIALATGVVYLRETTARGLELDQVARKMHFFLSIGENFFMEIAKLRAIKLMWSQVVRAFGGNEGSQKTQLHARCASRNKTQLDPHTNILRATSEALAAAIAGVDSITVPPFDAPLGESNLFSRRLARNLGLILQDELRLTEPIDPAGGSWHVEKLTDQLAQAAWTMFQDIEAAGGLLAALRAGAIQASIEAVARQRRDDLARRKTVLVGNNMFPNLDDRLDGPPPPPESPDNHDGAGHLAINPLLPLRLADDYTQLRRKAESYRRAHGAAPTILALGIGTGSAADAQLDFGISVFELGGFECERAGYDSVESVLDAAFSSRARACIVPGSLAARGDLRSFVLGLQAQKPEMIVVLAADPGSEDSLQAPGVDDFVFPGADCLSLNRSLQARLGVGK